MSLVLKKMSEPTWFQVLAIEHFFAVQSIEPLRSDNAHRSALFKQLSTFVQDEIGNASKSDNDAIVVISPPTRITLGQLKQIFEEWFETSHQQGAAQSSISQIGDPAIKCNSENWGTIAEVSKRITDRITQGLPNKNIQLHQNAIKNTWLNRNLNDQQSSILGILAKPEEKHLVRFNLPQTAVLNAFGFHTFDSEIFDVIYDSKNSKSRVAFVPVTNPSSVYHFDTSDPQNCKCISGSWSDFITHVQWVLDKNQDIVLKVSVGGQTNTTVHDCKVNFQAFDFNVNTTLNKGQFGAFCGVITAKEAENGDGHTKETSEYHIKEYVLGPTKAYGAMLCKSTKSDEFNWFIFENNSANIDPIDINNDAKIQSIFMYNTTRNNVFVISFISNAGLELQIRYKQKLICKCVVQEKFEGKATAFATSHNNAHIYIVTAVSSGADSFVYVLENNKSSNKLEIRSSKLLDINVEPDFNLNLVQGDDMCASWLTGGTQRLSEFVVYPRHFSFTVNTINDGYCPGFYWSSKLKNATFFAQTSNNSEYMTNIVGEYQKYQPFAPNAKIRDAFSLSQPHKNTNITNEADWERHCLAQLISPNCQTPTKLLMPSSNKLLWGTHHWEMVPVGLSFFTQPQNGNNELIKHFISALLGFGTEILWGSKLIDMRKYRKKAGILGKAPVKTPFPDVQQEMILMPYKTANGENVANVANVPLYCYMPAQWKGNQATATAMGIYIVFKPKSRPRVVAIKTGGNTSFNLQGVKLGMSVLKIQVNGKNEMGSKTKIEQELKTLGHNSKLKVWFGFQEKDDEQTRVWVYPPWVSTILKNYYDITDSSLILSYRTKDKNETKGIEFNVKLAADESSLFHPVSKGPWGLNDTKIKEFLAKCHYYVCRAGYKPRKKNVFKRATNLFFWELDLFFNMNNDTKEKIMSDDLRNYIELANCAMLHGSYIGALARAMYENQYHGFAFEIDTSGYLEKIRQILFITGNTSEFKSLYGEEALDEALVSFQYDLTNEYDIYEIQNPPPQKDENMDDDVFEGQSSKYSQTQTKKVFEKHIKVKQKCCNNFNFKGNDLENNQKHIKCILKIQYNLGDNDPDSSWVNKVLKWCEDYEDYSSRELRENGKVASKQTYEFNANSGVLVFNQPYSKLNPITRETLNLGRRNLQKKTKEDAILTIVIKFEAAKMQGVFVLDYVEFPHAIMTFTFGSEGDDGLALIKLLQNQLQRAFEANSILPSYIKKWDRISDINSISQAASNDFSTALKDHYTPGHAKHLHGSFTEWLSSHGGRKTGRRRRKTQKLQEYESAKTPPTKKQSQFSVEAISNKTITTPIEYTSHSMLLKLAFCYYTIPMSLVNVLEKEAGRVIKDRVKALSQLVLGSKFPNRNGTSTSENAKFDKLLTLAYSYWKIFSIIKHRIIMPPAWNLFYKNNDSFLIAIQSSIEELSANFESQRGALYYPPRPENKNSEPFTDASFSTFLPKPQTAEIDTATKTQSAKLKRAHSNSDSDEDSENDSDDGEIELNEVYIEQEKSAHLRESTLPDYVCSLVHAMFRSNGDRSADAIAKYWRKKLL